MPHITGKFRLYWPAIMLPFLIMIIGAQADDALLNLICLPSR